MIRTAVIGLGIGKVHVAEYKKHPRAKVVALVDLDEERLAASSAEYQVLGFRTIPEMLANVRLDAASICTPPACHAEQVEQLAQAGVHVLVEKPMAPSLADCRRMISAAERAGVKLMVGQKKRFSPLYAFLKRRFADAFGEPRWAAIKYALGRVDKSWFWVEDDGGGPILENAIHVFDLVRFLMGDVETVYAAGGNLFRPDVGTQIDTAAVTLKLANGGYASIACGYGSEWGFAEERISIATTRVCCEASGPFDRADRLRYIYRTDPRRPQEIIFEEPSGFTEEIAEFVEAIEQDRPPAVTGEDAARSIAVALAVKQSIRESRPVRVAELESTL